MSNTQHAQFSDENGNIYYLENATEDVKDESGNPISDGGDLSEASVKFTADTTRKLPQSGGRLKAHMGSIVKFLSDLKAICFSGSYSDLSNKPSIPSGAAASQAVANNCTTTAAGSVLDARQGKVLMDKANQLSSELDNSNRLTMLFDDGLYPQEVGETLTYNIKQDINEYKEMLFLCSMDSDCLREIRVPIALSNVRLGVSYYVDESYNCALEIIFNWTNKLLTVYLRNRKGYSTVGVNQIFGIK